MKIELTFDPRKRRITIKDSSDINNGNQNVASLISLIEENVKTQSLDMKVALGAISELINKLLFLYCNR